MAEVPPRERLQLNKEETSTSTGAPQRSPSKQRLNFRHRAQSIIGMTALDEIEAEIAKGLLCDVQQIAEGSRIPVLIAEIMFSSLWWFILLNFTPLLFNELLLHSWSTQYKYFVCIFLSPLLLRVGLVKSVVSSKIGLLFLRIVTSAGYLAALAPCSYTRLLVLSIGTAFGCLTWAGSWWNESGLDQFRKVYCHVLGYLLYITLWELSGLQRVQDTEAYALVLLCVGILCSIYLYVMGRGAPPINQLTDHAYMDCIPGQFISGVSLGCLLFLTQWFLGASLVPVMLPAFPVAYQYLIIITICSLSLALFSDESVIVGNFGWLLLAAVSSFGALSFPGIIGYVCREFIKVYIVTAWPMLSSRVCHHSHLVILQLSLLTHLILSYLLFFTGVGVFVLLLGAVTVVGLGIRTWCLPESSTKDLHSHTFFLGRLLDKLPSASSRARPDYSFTPSSEKDSNAIRTQNIFNMLQAEDSEYHSIHKKLSGIAVLIAGLSILGFALAEIPVKEELEIFSLLHHKL